MNCKKGDLAIVIKSTHGRNIGKVVECINLHLNHLFGDGLQCNAWETVPPLVDINGRETLAPDHFLRPIRDQDGEDETLTWAAKPEEVTA